MKSTNQVSAKLYGYAAVIAVSLFALVLGLVNGFARGHWFTLGLATDFVVCIAMVLLYSAERRRTRG